MLPIENCIIPISPARPGIKLKSIAGVTIHNTGNYSYGASARSHASYMASGGKALQTSYHYVVDDSHICQIIPDGEVTWHAGDGGNGFGNNNTISIEICVNPDSDLKKATENAAELAAYLLNKYKVETLYQHWHHSGKDCPHELRAGKPYSWETFVDRVTYYQGKKPATTQPKPEAKPTQSKAIYRVRKSWADGKSQLGAYSSLENAKKACKAGYTVYDQYGKAVYTNKPATTTKKPDGVLQKGSVVTSEKLSFTGIAKVNGSDCANIPALGGYFPLQFISEADAGDGKKDNVLNNTKSKVTLDKCKVEAIEKPSARWKNGRAKIHGIWVDATPLIEL